MYIVVNCFVSDKSITGHVKQQNVILEQIWVGNPYLRVLGKSATAQQHIYHVRQHQNITIWRNLSIILPEGFLPQTASLA